MSLEEFQDYVNSFRFYYFKSKEDFVNRIDCEGRNVSKANIKDSSLEEISHYTKYMAYGDKI